MNLIKKIKSLGYDNEYINEKVAKSIKPSKIKSTIEFFKLDRIVSTSQLTEEYKKRGLIPEAFAFIDYLEKNPEILDAKEYIAIQYPNKSYLTFSRWHDRRDVYCSRNDYNWIGSWWFCGVRKSGTRNLGALDSKALELLDDLEKQVDKMKIKIKEIKECLPHNN